jgi:hypothetical protein
MARCAPSRRSARVRLAAWRLLAPVDVTFGAPHDAAMHGGSGPIG